jgi:hypothetical protein
MLQGTLIAESIRPGTSLDDLNLIVRQITRHAPDGTTDEQPPIWTDIYFAWASGGAAVCVVPVPPGVRRALWVALG